MSPYLFTVGDEVGLASSMRAAALQADVFVVKSCMPVLGTQLQYRIKTAGEPYDRVVTEEQLTRVNRTNSPET